MYSRCQKGKSCGATCIERSKWCELELGPRISKSLTQAKERIGVLGLFAQVREQGIKGHKAKFDAIRKELKGELGRQIRKTDDIQELKRRLQSKGLLPKSDKKEDLGDMFLKQVKPAERAPSLPSDLKKQLAALGGAPKEEPAQQPRQLDRSPGARTKTPQGVLKKGETDLILDDISRLMRGETPRDIEIASGPGFEGFKARFLPSSAGTKGSATGNTRWAREDAEDFDYALRAKKLTREGSKSYNGWGSSYGSGSSKIGEGAYGTVIKDSEGTYVKRGAIASTEAALIKRLGERDLGPRLIAADINGKHPNYQEKFIDVREGRVAMGQVPGAPLGTSPASRKFGGKNAADIYWKAMADLHRMGIAHNDAHIENILVDSKGKGRWVDLGLAQASPKAALAEAMGIFPTLQGAPATRLEGAAGQGNWQTRRWDGTGSRQAEAARRAGGQTWAEYQKRFPIASQVWENRPAAQYQLQKMGLSREDISTIIDHGIRSSSESYTKGPWAKLTDDQALQVLNTLYDGI